MNSVMETYLKNMVENASPVEHIIMLYEKACECLENAISLYDDFDNFEKRKEFIENIDRVYDIVSVLKAFLDFEKGGEIAKNLDKIYTVILTILANPNKRKEELMSVLEIMKELLEAWKDVKKSYNKT